MLVLDVNILVYAFHAQAPDHAAYRSWLLQALAGSDAIGLCDPVAVGFLRVVTLPVWRPPATVAAGLEFLTQLRRSPLVMNLGPGPGHWSRFSALCTQEGISGNLVPDAWIAALTIGHGATLITADRDFSRFSGLSWRHPLRG